MSFNRITKAQGTSAVIYMIGKLAEAELETQVMMELGSFMSPNWTKKKKKEMRSSC